jgi:L-ascorbate metabolism protein UlaG (beta-lactamase superfamily)
LTRRHFFKKLLFWTGAAARASLFPLLPLYDEVHASKEVEQMHPRFHDLSLREMALKKIHHGRNRFLNPFTDAVHGNPWRIISWKLFHENRFKRFYDEEPVRPLSIDWEPIRLHGGLSITYLKHAGVMIKDMNSVLLIDPIFFGLGWLYKDFTPLNFELKEMPQPDHVLITHGHYDHLDKTSLASLDKKTHVITPLGYDAIFDKLGMKKRTQLDWFDTCHQGARAITLLPCNHWTMRNPFVGPNRSLWGSFLIKTASGPTVFISGDSAYFKGFREIGREFSIDLAMINLGAYEPRWFMATSHMNPSEVVQAFLELGADRLAILHWGSFRLGDEPVHFPPQDIGLEIQKQGLSHRLIRLNHGQTLFFDQFRRPFNDLV